MQSSTEDHGAPWQNILVNALKKNNVRLATYVPDRVLTPAIDAISADPFFTCFSTTREEEAVGVVSGAWLGGTLGVALMQTSGFATLPNVLASLCMPYQIPLVLIISERGTLGEFNIGQAMVCRTMRPVLDTLGIEHHTLTRSDEIDFVVDRSIKQAIGTQTPVAFILNPKLTAASNHSKGH